jgi:ESF2/ABP1 family protein
MMEDSRFDTSQWEKNELEGAPSKKAEDDGSHSEANEDESVQKGGKVLKPLSKRELESFEKKEKRKGIIYISRIPHGMTVAKVRHLLSGFGEVDRIYLQDGREKETGEKRTGRQSRSAHFTEGWIEFLDRKVAKATAEMLNAEPIGAASGGSGGGKGGKKAGGLGARRWRDEIWTMKYLSGFKWGMLSEQLGECNSTHVCKNIC